MTKNIRKKIYISHSYRDHNQVELLKSQLRLLKNIDAVWALDEIQFDKKSASDVIRELIDSSSMVVVFMAQTGLVNWQQYEIKLAKERDISIIGVSPTPLNPNDNVFHSMQIPSVPWTFEKLSRVLTGEDKSLSYDESDFKRLESPIIQIDFEKISHELILHLSKNPDDLYKITPRKFEELVAYLMEMHGYDVTLTQRSKDGGVDIFALHKNNFGNFLTLVECKQYSRNRPVGVSIVRSLYGVLNIENASHGIIATTSTFTAGAKKMAKQYKYRLSLKDHADILTWIKNKI